MKLGENPSFALCSHRLICQTQSMKQTFLMIVSLAFVACASAPKIEVVSNSDEAKAAIEREIERVEKIIIKDSMITDLKPVEGLTTLKYINLQRNRITDLTPLTNLKNLKVLILEQNRITDLTPLAGLTKLENLSLENNKVTDLTPLACLTGLTQLNLINNNVTDLKPLESLKGLRELELHGNLINDLSPLAGLTGLTELILHDNQITGEQLKYLWGLKQLKELSLSHNSTLTKAQITELQKTLPKCEINHNATK